MKYTFVEIAFLLATVLGGLCGGMVYRYYGYFYIYVITFSLHLMCLPWILFAVEETKGLDSTATWNEKIRDLFVFENLLKGWKVTIRARPNKGRALLLLFFASMCIIVLTYESSGISFIYIHHIYDWDPTTYNIFNAVFGLLTMLVLGITTTVLVKIFKVSDYTLGLVGMTSMMIKFIILAFAHYGVFMLYIMVAVGYLTSVVPLAIRSSVSKIADKDEIGKLFSFMATCEAIVPIFGTIAITKLFNATINIYPNVSYLITAGFLLIPLGTFLWAFIYLRKSDRLKEEATAVQ